MTTTFVLYIKHFLSFKANNSVVVIVLLFPFGIFTFYLLNMISTFLCSKQLYYFWGSVCHTNFFNFLWLFKLYNNSVCKNTVSGKTFYVVEVEITYLTRLPDYFASRFPFWSSPVPIPLCIAHCSVHERDFTSMSIYTPALKEFEAMARSHNAKSKDLGNENVHRRKFSHRNEDFHRFLLIAVRDHQRRGKELERSIRLRLTEYFQLYNPRDSLVRTARNFVLPPRFREGLENKIFQKLVCNRKMYSFGTFQRNFELGGMADHVNFKLLTTPDREFIFMMPRPLLTLQVEIAQKLDQNEFTTKFLQFLENENLYKSARELAHDVLLGLNFRNIGPIGYITLIMDRNEA